MISVLIPTYNYNSFPLAKNIHAQLESTNMPFELLIYDDGSSSPPDENDQIQLLNRATYRVLDKNLGRTAIRNKLAQDASFNWLLFLDTDVMPKKDNFLDQYINATKDTAYDVIFGGVAYQEIAPAKEMSLRWEYGKTREAKAVSERNKHPHFIISQNLLIKKEVFLAANTATDNRYGLDNHFSNELKRQGRYVLHIDNPVIHYGLENNKIFIKKALKAVETTVLFEKKGLMDNNLRPIQKAYLKLKKYRLQTVFSTVIGCFSSRFEKNFNSGKPNLFWFDLYRLKHYIDLKRTHNA